MAVDAVSSATTAASTTNSLGQDAFLKILLTQLTYQDPLKPLDNQEFIAQLAQFSSLEQTQQLNTKIQTLLNIQSSNEAVALLNKTVEVATDAASGVGQVTTVNFKQGQPFLTVKTAEGAFLTDVTLAQVSLVRP